MAPVTLLLRAVAVGVGVLGLRALRRRFSRAAVASASISVEPALYPPARRDITVSDDYHGTAVLDPYRWLEDPDAAETQAFVAAQNVLTESVLARCDIRDRFKARFKALYDYPKWGSPSRRGSRWFYFYNSGLQAQSVLYVSSTPEGPGTVLLDPNALSTDGTVALSGYGFSEDGSHLAYGLSSGGSDWQVIKVLKVEESGEPTTLPDELKFVKFSSIAWTHDGLGFFYNRYPEPPKADLGTETDTNLNSQLCYHRIGEPQSKDPVVFKTPERPKWITGCEVSQDGAYVVLTPSEGCDPVNRLFVVSLAALGKMGPTGEFTAAHLHKVVDNFEAGYDYLDNVGSKFVFKTNKGAPRYKIVTVDLAAKPLPAPEAWPALVPESPHDVLEWAAPLQNDSLVVCWLRDVKNALDIRSLATGALRHELPLAVGTVNSFTGRREHDEFFFKLTSFAEPGNIYRCSVAGQGPPAPTLFRNVVLDNFNSSMFETVQVFVTGRDGTKIPMFITGKKGFKKNGNNLTLLYGYGGFNISITPSFSASRVVFMQHCNGIVAVANIRGGGEYGEAWHKAGSLLEKQNCFDDFQACAQWLVEHKYTKPAKLAIEGGSNGGLLVGACLNQRPDLFGVGIAHVGVMDMLRFHRFTIGHAWCTDYGCSDKKPDFEALVKYSPLHTVPSYSAGGKLVPHPGGRGVAANSFPAMLVLTGDHDDRVVPLHSLKLIAELQHKLCAPGSKQRAPIVARIDIKSGHGAGKPTAKVLQEHADIYAFLVGALGGTWHD